MNSCVWKVLTAILLLGRHWTTGAIVAEASSSVRKSPPGFPPEAGTDSIPILTTPHGWKFDYNRDRANYGLSSEQCMAAFPELYYEIDRAMGHWEYQTIKPESILLREAGVRVLLRGQQLHVVQSSGMNHEDFSIRIRAVLNQLQRAVTSSTDDGDVLNTEFTISVQDYPLVFLDGSNTVWSFTRSLEEPDHDSAWVIPDFTLWESSEEAQPLLHVQDASRYRIREKESKVYWRGAANPQDRLNEDILLEITKDQSWADVEEISLNDKQRVESENAHCGYQLALATGDTSWPRSLTRILNSECDTVPVVPDIESVAHYFHLLQPDINYASVAGDLSDLEWRTRTLLWNTDEAQVIADNARVTFRERYTTPAATACYWRSLLRRWSTIAFEPVLYQSLDQDGERPSGKLRGVPLEWFLSQNDDVEYVAPGAYEPSTP